MARHIRPAHAAPPAPHGRRRRSALALVLAATAAGAALAQSQPYDPMLQGLARPSGPAANGNPALGGLPDGPGAQDTYYLCSACHAISLVTQQNLTDARWDYLWTWMIEEQGMPEQDAETRKAILDYLKTHFSAGG